MAFQRGLARKHHWIFGSSKRWCTGKFKHGILHGASVSGHPPSLPAIIHDFKRWLVGLWWILSDQLNWQTCHSHSLHPASPRPWLQCFFCIDINRNSIWANQMVKNTQKTHAHLCLESPPMASHSSISGARRFEGRKCGGQARRCRAATERIHFCGFANRKDSKRKTSHEYCWQKESCTTYYREFIPSFADICTSQVVSGFLPSTFKLGDRWHFPQWMINME